MNPADTARLAQIDHLLSCMTGPSENYAHWRSLRNDAQFLRRLLREAEAERDRFSNELTVAIAMGAVAEREREELSRKGADRDRAVAEARREAIEECASILNPGDWPSAIYREVAGEILDAIRALAQPGAPE
jgi:hypothetical protein